MIQRRINIVLAFLLLLVAALSVNAQGMAIPGSKPEMISAVLGDTSHPFYVAEGMASWYGKRFHGRKTANGERFNKFAMTCAHRRLPFGTLVRVTNIQTGDQIIVRVNDRGPYAHHRIIDLSMAAAEALDFTGCARVRIEAFGDSTEPLIARMAPQHHLKLRPVRETIEVAETVVDSTADTLAELVQPITPVRALMSATAEPALARRVTSQRQCGGSVRIVDTNDVPADVHGYSVVVAVTNRYAAVRTVREQLLARGYQTVLLVIANTCGESHYKVCVGVEPHPLACRITSDTLLRDYPTATVSYIDRVDDDQDKTTALAY